MDQNGYPDGQDVEKFDKALIAAGFEFLDDAMLTASWWLGLQSGASGISSLEDKKPMREKLQHMLQLGEEVGERFYEQAKQPTSTPTWLKKLAGDAGVELEGEETAAAAEDETAADAGDEDADAEETEDETAAAAEPEPPADAPTPKKKTAAKPAKARAKKGKKK